MGLRELVQAATPPDHGEDTYELKAAWDRYNAALFALTEDSRVREIAVLCADMAAVLDGYLLGWEDDRVVREAHALLARFAALNEKADNTLAHRS